MEHHLLSKSEEETQTAGRELARELFASKPVFVQLTGPLGAGKSAFARGFVSEWLALAGESQPKDAIVSPTYNIARVYGARHPLAHLDLYRVKSMAELEQIGYEHYFYEHAACLVEWLEQVPEALGARPPHAVTVTLTMGKGTNEREIRMSDR